MDHEELVHKRGCHGKKQYTSWRHAHHDMTELRRKRVKYFKFLGVYSCRQCGFFHVGKRPPGKTKKG